MGTDFTQNYTLKYSLNEKMFLSASSLITHTHTHFHGNKLGTYWALDKYVLSQRMNTKRKEV